VFEGRCEILKGVILGLLLMLLLAGVRTSALNSEPDKTLEIIHIRADGSVDPPTAPITPDGDVYTFTDNVYGCLVLSRSDIVVEGACYALQGNGSRTGIDVTSISGYLNVTIRNMKITGFAVGIELASFSKGTICGNIITNNGDGIRLTGFGQFSSFCNVISENKITNNGNGIVMEGYAVCNSISGNTMINNSNCGIALVTSMPLHSPAEKNIVSGNTVVNNRYGICLNASSKNLVYHNNFVNNTVQVSTEDSANIWDDGYPSGGNYWSDHVCIGVPSDGSEPCILDEKNIDRYPFQILDGWAF
jgi:parallel beta-helix repeat protein